MGNGTRADGPNGHAERPTIGATMANLPDDESCALCRFYINDESECRRHPPSVWLATASYREAGRDKAQRVTVTWPSVKPDDWCGEFLKSKNVIVPPIVAEEK